MKTILIIGAGRSSSSLIRYLLKHSEQEDWTIKVGDMDLSMAEEKIGGHPRGHAFHFDALDEEKNLIQDIENYR